MTTTVFPTSLDTFTDPLDPSAGQYVWLDGTIRDAISPPGNILVSANPALVHETQHTLINDAVAALEAKVGIDSSAVTSSLDYKIRNTLKIGGAVASGTAGSVLYIDGSGDLAQDNADFYWDSTNHRLGIGTTSPGYSIQVGNPASNTSYDLAISSVIQGYTGEKGLITTDGTTKLLYFGSTDSAGITYSFFRTNRGYDGINQQTNTGYYAARPGASLQLENDSLAYYQVAANSLTVNQVLRIQSGGTLLLTPTAPSTVAQVIQLPASFTNLPFQIQNSSGSSLFDLNVYGTFNLFMGQNAGNLTNTGGGINLGIGYLSLAQLTTGTQNSGLSAITLTSVTSGSYNTAAGVDAGVGVATGSFNSFFGVLAGYYVDQGINYSTGIGYNAQPTASHQIMLGTSAELVVCPNSLLVGAITSTLNPAIIGGNSIEIYSAGSGGSALVLRATERNYYMGAFDYGSGTCMGWYDDKANSYRLFLDFNGCLGIGDTGGGTGFSTQLKILSGDAGRSGLIVDTQASPSVNTAEFRINGTAMSGVDNAGNVAAFTAGRGFKVKEGSNAKMGTGTLVGGTVTIANTSVTVNSRIFVTDSSGSITNLGSLTTSKSAGTSFTVTSTNILDASTFAWIIFEPA